MAKIVTVLYNDQLIPCSAGTCPAPFVEIETEPVRYGKIWKYKELITLSGQIVFPKCGGNNQSKWAQIAAFRNLFSKDFKSLVIKENSTIVFNRERVKVTSVDVAESRLVGMADYTVNLECFPSDSLSSPFSEYSVVDPNFTVDISEEDDGSITISAKCSAKGIIHQVGPSDPLQSAITYVQNTIGGALSLIPSTTNVVGFSSSKAAIVSESEEINRLESSYSLSREYRMSARGTSRFATKISTDISYNEVEGVYNVSLDGSISGGMGDSMTTLREEFAKIKPFDICFSALNNVVSLVPAGSLNPNPISQTIDEEVETPSISFQYSYSSDSEAGNVYFTYDTDVSFEAETSMWSVSLNGNVAGKKGQLVNRSLAVALYQTLNLRAACQNALVAEAGSGVNIEDSPSSFNVSVDEISGEVTVSCSYNQKKLNSSLQDLRILDYSVEITRPINEWKPIQTMNNKTRIFDIESMKRGSISLSGNARAKDGCASVNYSGSLSSWMKSEYPNYTGGGLKPFIESIKVTRSNNGLDYSFSIEVSFEGGSLAYNH